MGLTHDVLNGQRLKTLTATELAEDSVGSSELADNAVDADAISAGVITGAKLTTPANTRIAQMYLADLSATETQYIFVAPAACTITEINIVVETTITANDTNYWTVQIRNLTGSNNLLATAQNTKAAGGGTMTADAVWGITPDQNATIASGAVIELQATKFSSGSNWVRAIVTVEYTVAT